MNALWHMIAFMSWTREMLFISAKTISEGDSSSELREGSRQVRTTAFHRPISAK
jgi:hypothetical protein